MAEHAAHNRGVAGSSPATATTGGPSGPPSLLAQIHADVDEFGTCAGITAVARGWHTPGRRPLPCPPCPRCSAGSLEAELAKSEKRVKVTLACEVCKRRNYITIKNKINDRDRIEMQKYCRFDRRHTLHKETR